MRKKIWIVGFVMAACIIACFSVSKNKASILAIERYRQDLLYLKQTIDIFVQAIEEKNSQQQLQQQFMLARKAYKKIEWLAEYYQPYTAKYINGPALDEVEADEKTKILPPEGFQVVEELIYPYDTLQHKELLTQAKILQSNIGRLQYLSEEMVTTDAHIFDALRLEIFRIIALGISGFDSPVAGNSMPEAAAALQGIQQYYTLYEKQLVKKDKALATALQNNFAKANELLYKDSSFASFNRMHFITTCLNPVSECLLKAQLMLDIPVFEENRALKPGAATLFAANIFNPDYYTAATEYHNSPAKAALGERLFYDVVLSGKGQRSCASCHHPDKSFTDGLSTSLAIDGSHLQRNAPTLINAALQPSLFYDVRVTYLEDQAKEVITNKDEMHGSLQTAVHQIKQDAVYRNLFHKAFKDTVINELHIKNALASYIRTLIALDAPFDRYMRGDRTAMNAEEINGFNIFMGKAKCGTCHFAPLFNGANVPIFNKIDAEVIGVPATADTIHTTLDPDPGKYNLYKIPLHQHAFKTPGLRNIALTAPYMHNGVFKTLEEVVDFYDRGGGAGLGFALPNQTLPEDRLTLTPAEKKALVAFMKTLTDTTKTSRLLNLKQ